MLDRRPQEPDYGDRPGARSAASDWPQPNGLPSHGCISRAAARQRGPEAQPPWGSKTPIHDEVAPYDAPMLSFLYLIVRAFARLLVTAGRDDGSKDLEILVLRHQLRVLQRKTGPPRLRVIDRVLLAAASRVIPHDRWIAFMVTRPPSSAGIASS